MTVLTKSSDQTINSTTFVNITDITASLDANSVYQIKGMVAISFTSFEKSPYIKLDGLPTSGVIMLEAHDASRSQTREIVNSNEFLEEFQLVNGTRYFPIDGIFQTSTSSTFNLQLKKDADDFTVTDDTFFILTKIK